MEYIEYLKIRFKGMGFLLLGGIVFTAGLFYLLTAIILVPLGLIMMGYGIFILNKLRWDREQQGNRLFHYRGGFE